MKSITAQLIVLLFVLPCVAGTAYAHGGRLNQDGCHTNRKTGHYHCHRSGGNSGQDPTPAAAGPLHPLAPASRRPPAGHLPGGAFRNCAEARAAGAAPVRRGQPGYGPHLDRDNDGIGCEPYKGK